MLSQYDEKNESSIVGANSESSSSDGTNSSLEDERAKEENLDPIIELK